MSFFHIDNNMDLSECINYVNEKPWTIVSYTDIYGNIDVITGHDSGYLLIWNVQGIIINVKNMRERMLNNIFHADISVDIYNGPY
jgi:hypothetical protein